MLFSTTLENGRLFKLMCKLGAVERNTTAASYETGDRYLLKLYRFVISIEETPNKGLLQLYPLFQSPLFGVFSVLEIELTSVLQ